MYILDTNALSELRRRDRSDPGLASWVRGAVETRLYLSVMTVFEIELGASRIARRDPAQGAMLRAWIDDTVLVRFADRILPINAAVATRAARLHVPDPRPERDALIAATALVHGFTVVTRNVADFEPTGVAVLNPWS